MCNTYVCKGEEMQMEKTKEIRNKNNNVKQNKNFFELLKAMLVFFAIVLVCLFLFYFVIQKL
jgi:predicted nucleic acid-binding Zn ribbon protein